MLIYGDDIIISVEGFQPADPLSGLEFCEYIQPPLLETEARTTMNFVVDINLEGELSGVARDVQAIIDSNSSTGLVLNASKCEITVNNFEMIDKFSIFKDFKSIAAEDLTLLGAPILEGRAVDNTVKDKIVTLERSIKRFETLYILRTSPCANNPLLQQFDMLLKNGLETILNVQLSDTQWKRALLPVTWETLSEERVHADTFSLSGFSCSHAPPPRSHPVSLSRRSRRHHSIPASKPRGAVWPTRPNPLTCPSTSNELGTPQSQKLPITI